MKTPDDLVKLEKKSGAIFRTLSIRSPSTTKQKQVNQYSITAKEKSYLSSSKPTPKSRYQEYSELVGLHFADREVIRRCLPSST